MSLYFQRQRQNLENTIPTNQKVQFDLPIKSSTTFQSEAPGETTLGNAEPDFQYQADGTIDLLRASTFIVTWNIATMTGLSKDGQIFELRKRDYEAEQLAGDGVEQWTPISSSAPHFKLSSSSAQTLLLITAEEITKWEKGTIALFNASSETAILTQHLHQKANILIYGIGPVDSDIANLYQYVNDLYEFISYSDVHVYTCRDTPFYLPGRPGTPGGKMDLNQSPDDYQYQIGVIWSGYTYNFWLMAPNNPRSDTLSQGRIYLLRADDFVLDNGDKPLTWYQGQVTFGTLWVARSGYTPIPVMLDNTGIYFDYTSTTTNVTNMKFTQTLILTPPEAPLPTPPMIG